MCWQTQRFPCAHEKSAWRGCTSLVLVPSPAAAGPRVVPVVCLFGNFSIILVAGLTSVCIPFAEALASFVTAENEKYEELSHRVMITKMSLVLGQLNSVAFVMTTDFQFKGLSKTAYVLHADVVLIVFLH